MPLIITADGFFRATAPTLAEPSPDAPPSLDHAFVTCAAAAEVQASWSTVERVGATQKSNPTSDAGSEESTPQRWTVVYLGDPDAVLDNDKMAALRQGLATAFNDEVFIVSSPAEGDVRLHQTLAGDALLTAAAVVGTIQAAVIWDRTDPIVVTCGHRRVAVRPKGDPETGQWTASAELSD